MSAPTTWLALAVGFLLGVLVAQLILGRVARALTAENDELRAGLRFVRAINATDGYRALVLYIDRLLDGEEA